MGKNTEMHRTRLQASKSEKGSPIHTAQRQTRQASSVTSVKAPKLTLGKMKTLQMMILDVKERRGVGYRWFERFHKHCFGWYQHIGSGRFYQVHATMQDYIDVKQVYDLLREDAKIDAELLTKLLEYIEQQHKCDAIIRDIIIIARRNTR